MHITLAAADRLLSSSGESWLPQAAEAFGAERDTMLASVGLPGILSPMQRRVTVSLGPITRADRCVRRQLAWAATSRARLFPVMEGSVTITDSGSGQGVLEVRAHYRPPLGPAGRLADRALLHLAAAASIRRFATQVAQRFEALAEEA